MKHPIDTEGRRLTAAQTPSPQARPTPWPAYLIALTLLACALLWRSLAWSQGTTPTPEPLSLEVALLRLVSDGGSTGLLLAAVAVGGRMLLVRLQAAYDARTKALERLAVVGEKLVELHRPRE